jgi:membrane-bound serine protease (ClpP class)
MLRGTLPSTRARRRPSAPRGLLAALLFLIGLAAACAPSIDQREAVHVLTYDGTVDPVMARYVDRGIDEAEDTDARAVVLRLDTPGGLVSSMEDIVKRINSSEVPVIVYVWPSGAHAASAGTFITMAGHIAAMAPGTRIGAASPVGPGGEDIEGTLGEKVEEDLAAFLRGIAEERGRNVEWAEDAVRNAVSASSDEAVELGVVDFEAQTLDDVLEQSEGRTVAVGEQGTEVTLRVIDAPVVENNRTFIERFLALLSDPNIAFLLLSLGALGLVFEFAVPGHIFPGVFGAIALVLAFFALGTLPVNWAGVALILLAFVLFGLEVYIAGFGALGIGGIVALILGGLLLTTSGNPEFQVNRWLVIGLSLLLGAFVLSAVSALVRTRRMPAYTGSQALVGRVAVARTALDPEGLVFFEGGRWSATAEDAPVLEGERVTITEVHGLKLRVLKGETPQAKQVAEAEER